MNGFQAAFLGVLMLACGAAARAEACKLEQMEIPVRIVDFRPLATLTINGTPVTMLVDSGAVYSFLSESVAAQLKLTMTRLPPGIGVQGVAGRVEARLTKVARVGFLGVEIQGVEFLVGGNELNAGIGGVLGRNLLGLADTEYDLAHGAVRISKPRGDCDKTNFAHWAGSAPVVVVPLESEHVDDTTIRVRVSVNGTRALAVLDTGAPRTSLSLRAAERAGIEERDMTVVGRVGGLGAGHLRAWTAPVKAFEVGGEKISDHRLGVHEFRDPDMGALVGLDYFLSHRIYVSRLQGQVYITWNGGPVFAQHSSTPGEYDARYAALPSDVGQDDASGLARRGAAAIASGNFARALEDLNRACELAPAVAENFYDRARVHLAMNHASLALADLDVALGLDPAMSQARFQRALLRMDGTETAGSLADLAQLDADLPSSAPLRADMADIHAAQGRTADALRQFDLWLSSHPNDMRIARVLNSRCWLRARLNIDLAKALDDCKDSVDRDNGDANSQDSLGWTYLRVDDASRARRSFDAAIKLKPSAFSLLGRGLAHLRLNDKAAAERDFRQARALDPKVDTKAREAGFEFVDAAKAPAS